MERRKTLEILGVDFSTPGKDVAQGKFISAEGSPMQWRTKLLILNVDIHAELLNEEVH